ncbi:hypothetical protein ABZ532_26645 [Streptomyces sp. NPDC019396]|uniref:hypothetical protein n=1 Tax=Streptomyces sp. NPDC019396 TaxID=3154687 RepID=UPI0034027EAF
MLPAEDGGWSGSSSGTGDLVRGVGALRTFQKRVNELLSDLEGGAGGSKSVAQQQISRASFSGANMSFAEADGLFGQYNRVHTTLVNLSKSLGDQIELLSIAVHATDVGFDNVEEDMRYRFHQIQTRLEEERQAREKTHGDKPTRETNDIKHGQKDLG